MSVRIVRSRTALEQLLANKQHDLRTLGVEEFARWMKLLLQRWSRDPVFVQRQRLRALRAQWPEVVALEREAHAAARAWEATAAAAQLQRLDRALTAAGRAQAGLAAAAEADPGRRTELEAKRSSFAAREAKLREQREELLAQQGDYWRWQGLRERLETAYRQSGIAAEQLRLVQLQREQGRGAGTRGARLEALARGLDSRIFGELSEERGAELRLLGGVRLGAARVEFDQLLVRAQRNGGPVDVLAAVEVKSNINGLAHGYRLRWENLEWLAGGARSEVYRSRGFPQGAFDRSAFHAERGARFEFTPASFRRFAEASERLRRLYFVTRPGIMWGLSPAALGRIARRVGEDPAWAPENPAYMAGLFAWCRAQAECCEAPDVVRAYLERAPDRVLLVERT